MSSFDDGVVLAAGRGERMQPLTSTTPKALASTGTVTLLDEQLRRIRAHVGRIHVTVGYLGEQVAAHALGSGAASVVEVEERGNSWWLHGSLLASLDQPVLVLTCDNFFDIDLAAVRAEYDSLGRPACMVVPTVPEPETPGDFIVAEGSTVVQLTREPVSARYCSGMQVLNPAAILAAGAAADDFNVVWRRLIEKGMLHVSAVEPRRWFGVDTVAQLERFDAWLAEETRPT